MTDLRERAVSIINFRSQAAPVVRLRPPEVLSAQDMERQLQERRQRLSEHEANMAGLKKLRSDSREQRALHKKMIVDLVEEKLREMEGWNKHDCGRRDAYRQRLVKEQEEYQAKLKAMQEAAARAAELAAEQVVGEEPLDKKKKGKK
nr:hypothetical protein HK105_004858 [Polyrhizophydium stewartii]